MEYIKHWCVGDPTYGTPGKSDNLGLTRQFLHSYFIEFLHPRTQATKSFLAPLPNDLREVLHKLEDRRIGLTEEGAVILEQYCQTNYAGSLQQVDSFSKI